MSGYEVAHLDEIEELNDGRAPYRPVRHHLGITAFGINSWTAADAGDRLINEHDESDFGEEELYFVQRGHAAFELSGESVGPIRALYDAGKYNEAADRGRELLDADPKYSRYSNLLYNLACTESLAG